MRKLLLEKQQLQKGLPVTKKHTNLIEGSDFVVVNQVTVERLPATSGDMRTKVESKRRVTKNNDYQQKH